MARDFDIERHDALLDDPLLRRQELDDRDDEIDIDEARVDMGLDDDDDE